MAWVPAAIRMCDALYVWICQELPLISRSHLLGRMVGAEDLNPTAKWLSKRVRIWGIIPTHSVTIATDEPSQFGGYPGLIRSNMTHLCPRCTDFKSLLVSMMGFENEQSWGSSSSIHIQLYPTIQLSLLVSKSSTCFHPQLSSAMGL